MWGATPEGCLGEMLACELYFCIDNLHTSLVSEAVDGQFWMGLILVTVLPVALFIVVMSALPVEEWTTVITEPIYEN